MVTSHWLLPTLLWWRGIRLCTIGFADNRRTKRKCSCHAPWQGFQSKDHIIHSTKTFWNKKNPQLPVVFFLRIMTNNWLHGLERERNPSTFGMYYSFWNIYKKLHTKQIFLPCAGNEPQISTVYPFFILKSTVKQNNATNASYTEACLLIQKDYFLPTILSMIWWTWTW